MSRTKVARVDSITPAQAARFGEWARKWIEIGLSTEPADFDAATEAALRAYRLCNLKRPMVILRMGSPYAATLGGVIAWAYLREFQKIAGTGAQVRAQVRAQVGAQVGDQVGAQVGDQVGAQVGDQVGAQVRAQVGDQVRAQVWAQVGDQVGAQVWAQVGDQVGAQVWAQVWDQVWDQVWAQVGDQVGAQVGDAVYNERGGAFWANWCAYFSFIRDVLELQHPVFERFEIDEQLTKSCGWVWWHENVLAISDRPAVLHRDARGRLHCETGPSIAYRDGWALHHWHGVLVPARVIEQPETLTVPQIESEQNAEVRRVMLERFGSARFLRESGAQLVHQDECGILYRKELAGDEPLVMVRVLNPTPESDGVLTEAQARKVFGDEVVDANLSVMQRIGFAAQFRRPKFKEYTLRVPPTVRTAREAVAWTFDFPAAAYKPEIQT